MPVLPLLTKGVRMDDETIRPVPNLDEALRNILQVLQADPREYRSFGCYWWWLKSCLKRHGYTTEHFYGLGEAEDREAINHIEPGPDELVLARALDFYRYHRMFFVGDPVTYLPATGEPYHLFDSDCSL